MSAVSPNLRLTGRYDVEKTRARRAVIEETRAAARSSELDPNDPRWVVAVRTSSQLQGSMLTPERRDRVMRTARQLGVRPFDANLIIAIVQDHARRGETLAETSSTIVMVPPVKPRSGRHSGWLRWLSAFACAATANAFLIWWLIG